MVLPSCDGPSIWISLSLILKSALVERIKYMDLTIAHLKRRFLTKIVSHIFCR